MASRGCCQFREIQRESAALVGQTVTLADRTARLVRQRSDQRIHREQYLGLVLQQMLAWQKLMKN